MEGKSTSSYFMHEDGQGFLKITVGRISDGKWEFFSDIAQFPPQITDELAGKIAGQYFSGFMSTKAQLFWDGKIDANSDDYGHPVLHA